MSIQRIADIGTVATRPMRQFYGLISTTLDEMMLWKSSCESVGVRITSLACDRPFQSIAPTFVGGDGSSDDIYEGHNLLRGVVQAVGGYDIVAFELSRDVVFAMQYCSDS